MWQEHTQQIFHKGYGCRKLLYTPVVGFLLLLKQVCHLIVNRIVIYRSISIHRQAVQLQTMTLSLWTADCIFRRVIIFLHYQFNKLGSYRSTDEKEIVYTLMFIYNSSSGLNLRECVKCKTKCAGLTVTYFWATLG